MRGEARIPGRRRFEDKPATMAELRIMSEGLQGQRADADCYPVCIKNVLDEYYGRMHIPPDVHRVALNQLNKACGLQGRYRPTSLPLDILAAETSSLVAPARIQPVHREGARSDWSRLKEVCGDSERSYPVVTMGPDFFHDPATPYRVRGELSSWHHGCVVLAADDDVFLFDPLAKRSYPREPAKYLLHLPRTRFLTLWGADPYLNELLWFEPTEEGLLAYEDP